MDVEQLRLVLETIEHVGGDAKEFGVYFILASVLPDVVSSVLTFTGVLGALWLISKTVRTLVCRSLAASKAAELIGLENLAADDDWTRSDYAAFYDRLRKYRALADKA